MRLLGIDIGGTKTAICIGNEDGKILASARTPTLIADSMDSYLKAIRTTCDTVLKQAGMKLADIDAIGISAPGPLSVPTGTLLAPPNNPGWKNVPIVKIISEMLNRPVFMNNDANAAVLAEYMFGQFSRTKDLVYLTFSTGMGGGIIAAGRLVQGVTDMGGEIGHQTLDINGIPCGCGRKGCFEAYVGGKNVCDRLKEKIRAGNIRTRIVDEAGGDISKIDHRAFAAAARAGDPFAVAEWDVFTERLAQGIGNIIMVLNPKAIVLGTIAIFEGDLVMQPLRDKLPKYTWEWPLNACTIAPSKLGGNIGNLAALAVGIAGLQPQRFGQ